MQRLSFQINDYFVKLYREYPRLDTLRKTSFISSLLGGNNYTVDNVMHLDHVYTIPVFLIFRMTQIMTSINFRES